MYALEDQFYHLIRQAPKSRKSITSPVFAPYDVALHNKPSDLWVSLLGRVYDLTPLIKEFANQPCIKPLLAHAGKDVSHWFDSATQDIQTHVHPVTGVRVPYTPHGAIPHVQENVPTANWKALDVPPWWNDSKYQIGILSRDQRNVRIVNTLTGQECVFRVCLEDIIVDIAERYKKFNADIDSYCWCFEGRELSMNKSLEQNGVLTTSTILEDMGMPKDSNAPTIMLCYRDDMKYDDDDDGGGGGGKGDEHDIDETSYEGGEEEVEIGETFNFDGTTQGGAIARTIQKEIDEIRDLQTELLLVKDELEDMMDEMLCDCLEKPNPEERCLCATRSHSTYSAESEGEAAYAELGYFDIGLEGEEEPSRKVRSLGALQSSDTDTVTEEQDPRTGHSDSTEEEVFLTNETLIADGDDNEEESQKVQEEEETTSFAEEESSSLYETEDSEAQNVHGKDAGPSQYMAELQSYILEESTLQITSLGVMSDEEEQIDQ